jgi:hypothetical protein
LGKHERDRLKKLKDLEPTREPPKLDEIQQERGVVLLTERGGGSSHLAIVLSSATNTAHRSCRKSSWNPIVFNHPSPNVSAHYRSY